MNINVLKYGSLLAAFFAVAWAANSIRNRSPVESAQTPVSQPPSQPSGGVKTEGDVKAYIGAVGIVEPKSELIAVGTNIAGVVTKVPVKPGDQVKAGDLLWMVDDRARRAELGVALADLRSAESKLKELEAQIAQTRARVESAAAAVRTARAENADRQDQFKRYEAIFQRGTVSVEEYSSRRFAADASAARLADAEARLKETESALALLAPQGQSERAVSADKKFGPTIEVQVAAVEKARATVAQAQTQLELCSIRAPVDASVLQVRVRAGEYAAAAVLAEPLMVLGVVDPLHVRVEIDESEIGRFHPEAAAFASLRGQSDRRSRLRFVRVEPLVIPKRVLVGTAVERVDTRVLQVIYALKPDDLPAFAGQQVDVYIEEKR